MLFKDLLPWLNKAKGKDAKPSPKIHTNKVVAVKKAEQVPKDFAKGFGGSEPVRAPPGQATAAGKGNPSRNARTSPSNRQQTARPTSKPPATNRPAAVTSASTPGSRNVHAPQRRRTLADDEMTEKLVSEEFLKTVEVLTHPDGEYPATEDQRRFCCFLSNGWMLLAKNDPLNPAAMQVKQKLLTARQTIKREYLVDLDVIRKIYTFADARFGGDGFGGQIDGVETQEFQKEFLSLVKEVAQEGGSDIHVTVEKFEALIRARVDGQIRVLRQVPSQWARLLCSAAFNMADAADNSYRPTEFQPARINGLTKPLPAGVQTIRLQFNPLTSGRYMICRLLYENSKVEAGAELESLGYASSHVALIRKMRRKPYGINVISGPTGSGKSTTLQRALIAVMKEKPGLNVITIEDPPEYVIPGAAQLPVMNASTDEERNEKFRQAISAALRSDPDIIMIGEIRDRASASLAFSAAMTGHQVWASLHANDAISILDRFRDQKVEDYKIADPTLVTGLIGQRLVRRLCPDCKIPFKEAVERGILDKETEDQVRRVCEGELLDGVCVVNSEGCKSCSGGYKGRTVIAECIVPDIRFMQFIREYKKVEAIAYWLDYLDGLTILEHACQKMVQGLCDPTDLEEKAGELSEFDIKRAGKVFGKLMD